MGLYWNGISPSERRGSVSFHLDSRRYLMSTSRMISDPSPARMRQK